MGGVSKFPNFQVSEFPSFQVSKFPSFWVSEFPSYRVSKFPSFQVSKGGRINERPGTDHVISGPMRGLGKNCTWWRKHTDRQRDMATIWPTRPSGAELVKNCCLKLIPKLSELKSPHSWVKEIDFEASFHCLHTFENVSFWVDPPTFGRKEK